MMIPLLLLISSCVLYLHNLSRSVYGGDVGDLVTAAYTGGVPHAPGYPLFSLLGFILSHILPFFTPAFAVGLISAVSGGCGVLLFYLLVKKLTENKLLAILSACILATSYLFWFYNEIAEVFALNNFFALLLLFLTVSLYKKFNKKTFYLFCLVVGLAGTNHQTITLILPGLLTIVGVGFWKFHKRKWKKMLTTMLFGLGFGLLGFGVYAYVPIASSFHPPINWDNVHDLPSFFHLLLRKDYGTFQGGIFLPPTLLQRFVILKTYSLILLTQMTIPVVILSVLGFAALLRKEKLLSLSIFSSFLLSGPFFVFYVGFPLSGAFYVGLFERFFILSSIMLLFFFPFGILFLVELLKKVTKKTKWSIVLPLLFFLIPLQLFFYNFPKTNLSHVYIGDTFGQDMLSPLPKDAILFSGGDTTLFNTWYAHFALHTRPDVQVVNLNGLSQDTYFLKQKTAYLKKYPQTQTNQLLRSMLQDLNKNRQVFSIDPIEASGEGKLRWIPYGLTYKLLQKNEDIPAEEEYRNTLNKVWQLLRVPYPSRVSGKEYGSLTITQLPEAYANALLAAGNFFLTDYQDSKEAKIWYDKALVVSPTYPKTYSILGVWYLTLSHECDNAASSFEKAHAFDPLDQLTYFFLYTTYTNCQHDTKKAKTISNDFTSLFHQDFQKSYNAYMKGQK